MTLRDLPPVDRVAADEVLAGCPRAVALAAARAALEDARTRIRAGEDLTLETVLASARHHAEMHQRPRVRMAINATGIVLHTNLGRATLAPAAALAAGQVAGGHATIETDPESGARGSRQEAVSDLLRTLTGAEDALVVNNAAGATVLAVAAIAAGADVLLSYGEMVEIGGQFRLPDVIESAAASLVGVGTTNRTRIGDYEKAITERTRLLLKCHPSNYQVVGFTEETSLGDLVRLGAKHGIAVGDDLGSGALVDLSPVGLSCVPSVSSRVAQNPDVVWFSGDKLLGGPQAGILVGKRGTIGSLKRHPLCRALRPDKVSIAALEATLMLYRDTDPWKTVPTLRRLSLPVEELMLRARRLVRRLRAAGVSNVRAEAMQSEVGAGAAPGTIIASAGIAVSPKSPAGFSRKLRMHRAAVYGRIQNDSVLLDLRTVEVSEETELLRAITDCFDDAS